ncbi:ATP-dependent DNA ligase [Candidatus Woesearchaeota archaeon]|nr:ATP-dependent DNA ligase [Candidatus Woesearchaeota archaeon]
MYYSDLVKYYEELEKTTKRLEKVEILSRLLNHTSADKLDSIIYLIRGKVFPDWDERKIGYSSRLILKAISSVTGINQNDVEKLWKKKGDLGSVVEELIKHKKQTTLSSKRLDVDKVINNLRKLSEMEGEGTVSKKVQLVSELISNANPKEAKFVVKTVLNELRVGVKEGIIRDSISRAFNADVKEVENAFNLTADYGEVAKLAKKNKLKSIEMSLGRPTKLMLAILVKDAKEGFEALRRPLQAEPKIDGFRVAVHKDKNNVRLFTRRMEEVTKQFPDIVEIVKEHVKTENCIIDCEAVGIDKKTGKHMAFQKISQRIKRKYDIEKMAKEFPVELNVFDVIYCNGKSLMNETLKERRKILEKIIEERKEKIVLTKKLISDDEKKINEFFKESLKEGNEGLMLKNIDSLYIPGRYVNGWCKLKNVLEPLDLVIIGAEFGDGKRAGWLSSFIVACRDKNKFLECGRVSTGIKEKEGQELTYKEMTKLLKPLIEKEEGKVVHVKPKIIIEVGYEEIQKSPTYSSGYALRFPRVLQIRTEKPLSEINTLSEIERVYKIQRGKR